jgi:rhamnosyltransferase
VNRLCIFAHYDKDDLLDEYAVYLLEHLKKVSGSVIFVSTSRVGGADIAQLETLCSKVILRENAGYDFASWQAGMKSVANIADFDELIICNDSAYGPFYPLSDIFNIMSQKDCDFWGMTDNYEIAYHLQSYFQVFKKGVINSEIFKNFWNGVKSESTKQEIIRKYEVDLTQSLMSAGFKPCAYASISPSIGRAVKARAIPALRRPLQTLRALSRMLSKRGQVNYRAVNPTHFFWKELIVKYSMPFLKIELLRDNPQEVNIKGWEDIIKQHSDYNLDLIRSHLDRVRRCSQS